MYIIDAYEEYKYLIILTIRTYVYVHARVLTEQYILQSMLQTKYEYEQDSQEETDYNGL